MKIVKEPACGLDVGNTSGKFEVWIRKGISCGEIIDPTILNNRIPSETLLGNQPKKNANFPSD